MKIQSLYKFILSIMICEMAGVIGSFFTISSIPTWYTTIIKPTFNPPNWIFGPVWITLFALMGISLFLIWNKENDFQKIKFPVLIFICQLILNIFWSIIFFGFHNIGGAFIEIIILWIFILITMISFYKIDKLSAYLLLPYILWVSFAMYLNYAIWILNQFSLISF